MNQPPRFAAWRLFVSFRAHHSFEIALVLVRFNHGAV
jgi:hypothetical protein